MMASLNAAADVAALRAFNRVYTRKLGLLNGRLDQSPFSLSEARVLYEIAHRTDPTAAEIGRELGLDRAQLSRTLKRFAERGLVTTRVSPAHARRQLLQLTPSGRRAFSALNRHTEKAVASLLGGLGEFDRHRLLRSADSIRRVFAASAASRPAFTLRGLQPGDLGWVISRQATLYAEEYGWDWSYEGLVCEILAEFVKHHDPPREQGWIAEIDGEKVGAIFLMRATDRDVGKLRLLHVEKSARGRGIGRALVDACIDRARAMGLRKLTLWTNSVLVSARRIYEAAGFRLEQQNRHHSFGHDLIGETWGLDLTVAATSAAPPKP